MACRDLLKFLAVPATMMQPKSNDTAAEISYRAAVLIYRAAVAVDHLVALAKAYNTCIS